MPDIQTKRAWVKPAVRRIQLTERETRKLFPELSRERSTVPLKTDD